MTPRFVFAPAAEADLREARDWYEQQRAGLSSELEEVVRAALDRIATHPDMYPDVVAGVRRAVLPRFPYSLFYSPHPSDRDVLEIIAVFHHRREPTIWRGRAAG